MHDSLPHNHRAEAEPAKPERPGAARAGLGRIAACAGLVLIGSVLAVASDESIRLRIQANLLEDPSACYELSKRAAWGIGQSSNSEESKRWLERAIRLGDPQARRERGAEVLEAAWYARTPADRRRLALRAIELGVPDGYLVLVELAEEPQERWRLYRLGAAAGCAEASLTLGRALETGAPDVARSSELAVESYRAAVVQARMQGALGLELERKAATALLELLKRADYLERPGDRDLVGASSLLRPDPR